MELTTRITDFPNTLQEATECIKSSMRTAAQAFVGTGYYLKYIRDKHMYQEAGYIDIWEYGKGELGLSKTMVSRYISINDRFSQNGNSPILLEEYKGYGYSKLSEMLTLADEEISAAGITETTTIARIREVKKELKEEEPEIPEQIPGQTEITDFLPDTETEVVTMPQGQDDLNEMILQPVMDIIKEMAKDMAEGIIEDNDSETATELLTNADKCREHLHFVFDGISGIQFYCDGEIFECETKHDDDSVYVYKCYENKNERTGAKFAWPINSLISEMFNIYKTNEEFEVYKNKINTINTSAETEKQKKYTLDEMATYIYENMLEDKEKIIAAAGDYQGLAAAIGKRYSGLGGCAGPGQPRVKYNGKEFIFDNNKPVTYKLTASVILDLLEEGELKKVKPEEEVVEAEVITESSNIANAAARDSVIKDVQYNGCAGIDVDGESYTCPPRRKPCDMECKWKPSGQTHDEKTRICNECWRTYVKELIERDRNGEITPAAGPGTVSVKNDTIEEQPELPILKNNEQRKAWIEKFEEWPLWIDNKETQERFYRYAFENGDAFVIRQAYTQRPYWDYTERKSIKKPGWAYKKEYIVREEEDLTLSDSETSTTAMVEYLKNMQKKQED